jgi:hypothetical protein
METVLNSTSIKKKKKPVQKLAAKDDVTQYADDLILHYMISTTPNSSW